MTRIIPQREAEQALYGLEADSRYLVKVQTINEFGASKWSEEWQFDTFEGISRLSFHCFDHNLVLD